MGVTNLPTGCWLMVAVIAAFTVWICLSIFGTVLEYERRRRSLGDLAEPVFKPLPQALQYHFVVRHLDVRRA